MADPSNPLLMSPFMGFAHHRILLDDTGMPVDYEFLEVNQAFENMTGMQRDRLVGYTVRQVLPGIEADTFDWIGCYGELALKGGHRDFEQYNQQLGRWYRVYAYSTEQGYFSTIFLDISESKKQTEDLEGFFAVNLDLLCIADLEGRFIRTNEAWERILGYTCQELHLRPFLDFVHPDDLEPTKAALALLRTGQDVVDFTNRYRAVDGYWRFIEWRSRPKGQLVYAAARDITEQKRSQDALRESEANFRAFFDSMDDMVVVVGQERRILYMNESTRKKTGYSLEELDARGVFGLYLPEDRAEAEAILGAMFRGEKLVCSLPIQRKDGTVLPVETRVSFGQWNG